MKASTGGTGPREVLDIWSEFKPAYRVTLEDGTELVTSGDHRFLTGRGWKHVTGAEQGPLQRPHLTVNNKLMGTGRFGETPLETPDYRRGYLCGVIRGDGTLGRYEHKRSDRRSGISVHHHFRLALTDLEALRRARDYLAAAGVQTGEFEFKVPAGYRPMRGIRTQKRAMVQSVRELIEWPRQASDDWCKGFLAGIFDAEGSYGDSLRIHNTDSAIVDWTTWCLRRLGFMFVVEDRGLSNGMRSVRLLGGLVQQLRFLQTVDVAITRKRSLEGKAVKTNARLGVVSIEPPGRRTTAIRPHHRHGRLHCQWSRQPQLLRSPHPHLPRLRRWP